MMSRAQKGFALEEERNSFFHGGKTERQTGSEKWEMGR